MKLLPVSHIIQRQQADCLATCVAIVLEYLVVPYNYNGLLKQLQITAFGAPFSNIRDLRILGVVVAFRKGDIGYLRQCLHRGWPVIVAVDTTQLSYWEEDTNHAVVVIGIDRHTIALSDPGITHAPQLVALDEFELAWLENDYVCAVLHSDLLQRKGVI